MALSDSDRSVPTIYIEVPTTRKVSVSVSDKEDSKTKISLNEISTPCFVVDLDKVHKNATKMKDICKELDVLLRPHTKTHKTIEAAVIQTGGSKRRIAVSTLTEAELYAGHGFDDILLAHPISENKIERCLSLMKKLKNFHVMVSDKQSLAILEKKLPDNKKWSVVLEVDAGYGRTGLDWDSQDVLESVDIVRNSGSMFLNSLYIHCGNSYDINIKADRKRLQTEVISRAKHLQARLSEKGISCPISTGSTPTCSLPEQGNSFFSEFHPGNYIFYDYQQYLTGSCGQQDIAGRVMTRVIDHKPRQNLIIVDCGFTALSHDGMRQRPTDFCVIEGETNLRLVGMSQEIGKISAKEGELDCRNYPIGTIFFIVPYHVCATAALHAKYYVHSGSEVKTTWSPVRGW